MKTLTNQLRALAIAPEFEDTTTAKLFLDLASRADAIEDENAKLRACADQLSAFACAYRSHPKRNPNDQLDAALSGFEALRR